jgi:hypothetical protein
MKCGAWMKRVEGQKFAALEEAANMATQATG